MDRHAGQVSAPAVAATTLLRLLHLASPSLPVGAYSYSQGLEAAIDAGLVADEPGALAWIRTVLAHAQARLEAPLFCRLHRAWAAGDAAAAAHWAAWFVASRDTAELRAETLQMGYSLARLLAALFPDHPRRAWLPADAGAAALPYPAALAAACTMLELPLVPSLQAGLFAWAENQVLAAIKAVPLGQLAGQRMLFALEPDILAAAACAAGLADDDLSNWTPGLSLLSMRHETQHNRIFRS
ncbi:MAG: urease accessory protein UreF [Burkholderiales bacterium]|nr:urease accessory protein UreF [Burkholderiales bacterium]